MQSGTSARAFWHSYISISLSITLQYTGTTRTLNSSNRLSEQTPSAHDSILYLAFGVSIREPASFFKKPAWKSAAEDIELRMTRDWRDSVRQNGRDYI